MRHLQLGLIGNCAVNALVDTGANIVWACMPRFDSDPPFCALINNYRDKTENEGIFSVEVADMASTEQRYMDNTAVLVTRIRDSHDNALDVIDFCPRFKHSGRTFRPAMIVRMLRVVKGAPNVKIKIRPMQDHGGARRMHTVGSNHIRYVAPHTVDRLTTNMSITAILEERWQLLNRDVAFILGPDENLQESVRETSERFLRETCDYWVNWVRYLAIPFEWQEQVIRAAITLKLSAFEDTGAIIAACTTSLPEAPENVRNWDYRFCWLRDSYFTVNALNRLGATQTMERYLDYITNVVAQARNDWLQPVYGIAGEAELEEHIIPHLAGYDGYGPVRIGNLAFQQAQHDVYGAVVLSLAQMFFDRRILRPGNLNQFERLERIGDMAMRTFGKPDAGLWELRGRQETHTFSSVMCWAACDRLARIAERLALPERAKFWKSTADRMHADIVSQAWNERRKAFAATFAGEGMDASLLLLRELGFLSADDPRFASTVDAIAQDLKRGDYVFRYVIADDFGAPDHAFTICTFWYIKALVDLNRRDEARQLFENILSRSNHLGLLAEHIDPATGEMWGNFPQTYSMVGVILSAMKLSIRWEEAI